MPLTKGCFFKFMDMDTLLGKPTFIPKILDTTVIKSGISFPVGLIDAHYVASKPNLLGQIREVISNVIIDPVTYFIQFEESREKASFQLLPYAKVDDVQKLYSDPTYRLNSFVIPTIDFQYDHDNPVLVAPYLCSDDINSTVFSTNLTLLGEAITNIQGREDKKPLLAPICIGSHILADPKLVNFVVDCYKDDSIYDKVDGFLILVNDLDDRQASTEILLGLAHLVYQLSREKKVIVNKLGGFGEILNIIGSDGFVSSPAAGETFSMKQLQTKSQNVRGRDHRIWTYVPELFDYVNEVELASDRINYKCDCDACTNVLGLETLTSQRKAHFLIKRMESIDALDSKSRDERIKIMIEKLEQGIERAQSYVTKYGSDLKISHMVRWKSVLEASIAWNYEEDDEELDSLLDELD